MFEEGRCGLRKCFHRTFFIYVTPILNPRLDSVPLTVKVHKTICLTPATLGEGLVSAYTSKL